MDDKSTVLYVHAPATEYECGDCVAFIPERNQCVFHGFGDNILPYDSCGLWMKGSPGRLGSVPMGLVTKLESGWARSNFGFGCKRCVHYDKWNCDEVDKDSAGDDPGMIHPEACCNEWAPDPVRSFLPTNAIEIDKPYGYYNTLSAPSSVG